MSGFHLLTKQIADLQVSHQTSGVAVSVIEDGQVVYAQGFGTHLGETVIPKTRFEVASLSKPVFAYAVLKLVEKGVIGLDTPLAEYLPAPYLPNEPDLPLMTARHALSHTTGFPNWRDEAGLRTSFHPGSAFQYSTEGLIYLQTALEHRMGVQMKDYMAAHLFTPFGMLNSRLDPSDMNGLPDYLPRHLEAVAALTLSTTVLDYSHFLLEMMGSGDGDNFRLSRASLDEMLRPQIRVGDQKYLSWGLGWGIQHHPDQEYSFWHWGQRRSRTRNFAMSFRQKRSGIVIFTNAPEGLILCERITRLVFNHLESLPAFRWLLPPEQWRADGRILV